jgi:hypothetical protein
MASTNLDRDVHARVLGVVDALEIDQRAVGVDDRDRDAPVVFRAFGDRARSDFLRDVHGDVRAVGLRLRQAGSQGEDPDCGSLRDSAQV